MKIEYGDIWAYIDQEKPEYLLIPTNGYITQKGLVPFGAGFAKAALERYPHIDGVLGTALTQKKIKDKKPEKEQWNIPVVIGYPGKDNEETVLFSFPTKPGTIHKKEHLLSYYSEKKPPCPGFMGKSQLSLIARSAYYIQTYIDRYGEQSNGQKVSIVLPQVGCGLGELSWKDVEPILQMYFNKQYTCIIRN